MDQEILQQTLEIPEAGASGVRPPEVSGDPELSRTTSSSRLNAQAPEFVPRAAPPLPLPAVDRIDARQPRLVPIHHGPPPMMHVYHPAPPSPPFFAPVPSSFEYYGGGGGAGFGEQEAVPALADSDPAPPARDGLSDEVIQKITKQVEYYFSDINLATTEHLMRFISKDPEGFVPISVIAAFKKIKALVHNNSLLAMALRTSSKLVVSDDGKKVRRQQPFTESDMEELQSRIVVAENLPEDHCYQNLMKVFSAVGSVKMIRTCYPQLTNGTTTSTNKSAKLDMLFGNRLHAFIEYETVEDAEKAIAELNDEKNWRSGLRVRLLLKCMTKHGPVRGRKGAHEGDVNGEGDVSTSDQPNDKLVEDPSQLYENVGEALFSEKDGGLRRGRGRGRGGKGRGRGQYHNNNLNGGHMIGSSPSSHPVHTEQPVVANKQPPGPRMPDGTRGFTMGRGKLVTATSMV
ncbi:la-related protein 6B [Elaeis guineensis]|uniref:La-related protein 6B n=1 Tax=Elaeis guineensis var. tenera TaxID=51953 RepID=A0A6I9RQH4_ELAGV|nr:la-related protein 6B [Elaeis guineensis]